MVKNIDFHLMFCLRVLIECFYSTSDLIVKMT